jgi:hypothetical protein
MNPIRIVAGLGIVVLASIPAFAQTQERMVKAGGSGLLGSFGATGSDCKAVPGAATIVMRTKPEKGSLGTRTGAGFPEFPKGHALDRCNKVKSARTEIWYTPQPGFRGQDEAVLEVTFPNGSVSRLAYRIVVQ